MSLGELKEFTDIIETAARKNKKKDADIEKERDLTSALQALLFHQCVYSDHPHSGRIFDTIHQHRTFFEKYVGALGYELLIDRRDGMAAIRPRPKGSSTQNTPNYGWNENRLKKDETLILLSLRYIFEDKTRRREMDDTGRVFTDTDQLFDTYLTLSKSEPPSENRLREILKFCRRKGLIKELPRDSAEHYQPLQVLPGIAVLVSDVFIQAVMIWAEEETKTDSDEDLFDFIQKSPDDISATINPNLSENKETDQDNLMHSPSERHGDNKNV